MLAGKRHLKWRQDIVKERICTNQAKKNFQDTNEKLVQRSGILSVEEERRLAMI